MQQEILDLLVVGAGATGTGTALDAAARGLSVGLIDQGDVASGTSSRSSQLVHGGLRYLKQGNVGLVREALRERELLLTTLAPSLVRPMPFLLPLRHRAWERAYLGAGLVLYDALAHSGTLPRHRHLSRRGALDRFPGLDQAAVVGALEFHDAKMDDAGLAVAIARTAAEHGAAVATHAALVGSQGRDADGIWRVTLRDEISGVEMPVGARAIALCVGVWAPEVSAMFTARRSAAQVVRSKGVHLRLRRDAIDGHSALIVPTGRSVLFVIPASDHWVVGTTDTEWTRAPEAVAPSNEDVDYLLGLLSGILARGIDPSEVTYAYAGLRPLVRDSALGSDTAKLTREHRITRIAPGLLGIAGGKWTTYRVMARDLVDTVLLDSGGSPRPCLTHGIPLVASRESEVAALVEREPGLGQPLVDAPGFCHADVVQACLSEGAMTADDIIERRLRLHLHLDRVTDDTVRAIETLRKEAAAAA